MATLYNVLLSYLLGAAGDAALEEVDQLALDTFPAGFTRYNNLGSNWPGTLSPAVVYQVLLANDDFTDVHAFADQARVKLNQQEVLIVHWPVRVEVVRSEP